MSAAHSRREQAELRKSDPGLEAAPKAPRPDCAIWNDIARALGAKPEQSK
jgi:hypothetical protein